MFFFFFVFIICKNRLPVIFFVQTSIVMGWYTGSSLSVAFKLNFNDKAHWKLLFKLFSHNEWICALDNDKFYPDFSLITKAPWKIALLDARDHANSNQSDELLIRGVPLSFNVLGRKPATASSASITSTSNNDNSDEPVELYCQSNKLRSFLQLKYDLFISADFDELLTVDMMQRMCIELALHIAEKLVVNDHAMSIDELLEIEPMLLREIIPAEYVQFVVELQSREFKGYNGGKVIETFDNLDDHVALLDILDREFEVLGIPSDLVHLNVRMWAG
jgi:hypothetical protein